MFEYLRSKVGDAEVPTSQTMKSVLGSLTKIGKAFKTDQLKSLVDVLKDTTKNKKYAAFLYGGATMSALSVGNHIIHPTEAGRIPKRTRKRWDIDEYYDALKYVKYRSMFLKTAQKAKREEGIDIEQVATELEKRRAKNQEEITRTTLSARRRASKIKHGIFENPFHVLGAHLRPIVDSSVRYWDDFAKGASHSLLRRPANFMSNMMHRMFATYEERQGMKQKDAENLIS